MIVEEEKPVPVIYDELQMECGFRADLLVAPSRSWPQLLKKLPTLSAL
ncbi:MAG: hypothetical protein R3C53_09770 [Pirellulaceae bacterium]